MAVVKGVLTDGSRIDFEPKEIEEITVEYGGRSILVRYSDKRCYSCESLSI